MIRPISISLNFDSLNEAYGFPNNYKDPSFKIGFERLAKISAKYNFPLTIFVVGKDLTDPENAAKVKEWSDQGHEIGNHTWSHHFNLASLNASKIRDEVLSSHELITQITGIEPKGFIAPAWSTSSALIKVLLELNYSYDTSVFPSIYLYPMVASIVLRHWNNPKKGLLMLNRKDWLGPFFFPNKPFHMDQNMKVYSSSGKDKLLILPLPTKNCFSLSLWHTMGFMQGWVKFKKKLKKMCTRDDGFYYLIHPADFLGIEDLSNSHSMSLARMQYPLKEKLVILDEIFSILKESGRPVKTMSEMANNIHLEE